MRTLEKWRQENRSISEFVVLKEEGMVGNQLRVLRKRQIAMLTDRGSVLKQEFKAISAKLDAVLKAGPPSIGFVSFDFQSENMMARKLCAVRHMILRKRVFVLNQMFDITRSALDKVQRVLSLLEKVTSKIPLEVAAEFFNPIANDKVQRAEAQVKRLQVLEQALSEKVQGYVLPLWVHSFSQFVECMVVSCSREVVSDLGYVPRQESEVSLSRCFFHNKSSFLHRIDSVIERYGKVDNSVFVEKMLQLCLSLIPQGVNVEKKDESVMVVFMFRVVFDRFYEKHHTAFAWVDTATAKKVATLGSLPSSYFSVPYGVMTTSDTVSMRDLFLGHQEFMRITKPLEEAFFISNPLDVLYEIHQSISMLQKLVLTGESRSLSFDDMFSLLFGTVLASDIPDVMYLEWFVCSFAPSQALSPALDYALASIEALCRHVRALEPEKLSPK